MGAERNYNSEIADLWKERVKVAGTKVYTILGHFHVIWEP